MLFEPGDDYCCGRRDCSNPSYEDAVKGLRRAEEGKPLTDKVVP